MKKRGFLASLNFGALKLKSNLSTFFFPEMYYLGRSRTDFSLKSGSIFSIYNRGNLFLNLLWEWSASSILFLTIAVDEFQEVAKLTPNVDSSFLREFRGLGNYR